MHETSIFIKVQMILDKHASDLQLSLWLFHALQSGSTLYPFRRVYPGTGLLQPAIISNSREGTRATMTTICWSSYLSLLRITTVGCADGFLIPIG